MQLSHAVRCCEATVFPHLADGGLAAPCDGLRFSGSAWTAEETRGSHWKLKNYTDMNSGYIWIYTILKNYLRNDPDMNWPRMNQWIAITASLFCSRPSK